MSRPHRIAAGAIVIHDARILLVRYRSTDGGSYLVCPGGALQTRENAFEAAVRETFEETGVVVAPKKLLFIEDLLCTRFKMCKIWILCDASTHDVKDTQEARIEGITEARWYDREQLEQEIVFPAPVKLHRWEEFMSDKWQTKYLTSPPAGL